MKFYCAFLVFIIFIGSCTTKPSALEPEDYKKWIAEEENGLEKKKLINGVSVMVKFLPPEYLAYKEFLNSSADSFDSIFNFYKCGLTFQVRLQSEKNASAYGNLLHYDLASQEELSARINYLNFKITEFIKAKHNELDITPSLAIFEGYDALSNSMNFQVVFDLPEYNCGNIKTDFNDIQLVFSDPLWDLGVTNFLFTKKAIVEVPTLKI